MPRLEWLPLAWLRTGMLALTVYAILPLLGLNLRRIASAVRLGELHVYYAIIVFWEIVTVAILFYLMGANDIPLDTFGFRGGLSFEGVFYAIGGVIFSGLLYPVVQRLMKALGWSMFWQRREDRDWFPRTGDYLNSKCSIIAMFLIVVVCIPILEEIIYRGYVFTALQQNLNSLFVVFVLTSLIFASIHCLAGPGFVLYIFLGTFAMAFVYWKTSSIYPCILMHALNTLIGEIIIPLQEKTGKKG